MDNKTKEKISKTRRERIKNGQQNIFTKDKVVYFASTSGTTNKIKLICAYIDDLN